MNQEKKTEGFQPTYPQYINTYDQQDDISLVDLWIVLLKFKKVYLWSFIFSVMVGISAVTLFSTPRFEMTTVLEIANYNNSPIETPAAVISRINNLILPKLEKDAVKATGEPSFEVAISHLGGIGLIVIKNEISEDKISASSDFHSKIVARVVYSHQDLLFRFNSYLRKAIVVEETFSSEPLTRDEYIKKFEPDKWNTINLLESSIKKLSDFKIINQTNNNIEKLEQIILANQEVETLMSQKISLIQDLVSSFNWYRAKAEENKRKILELNDKIGTELTRVVTQSEVSREPVNRSKSVLYSIVILLSLFLAFAFTLIVMFRAKVIERLAEEG